MATNWFPHDSSANNDQRILLIREKYGWEGYGLYWAVLEAMYETGDAKLDTAVLRALYLRFSVKKEMLLEFIQFCVEVNLFVDEDGAVFSERLVREKERMIEKSEQARLAVSMRTDRRLRKPKSTDVVQMNNGRSTPPHPTLPTPDNPETSLSAKADVSVVEVVDLMEKELRTLLPLASQVLSHEKRFTDKALKKWTARRRTFSAMDIAKAFENLRQEPDRWKIKNNGWRSMEWWLAKDARIEEMQNCHLKGGGLTIIA